MRKQEEGERENIVSVEVMSFSLVQVLPPRKGKSSVTARGTKHEEGQGRGRAGQSEKKGSIKERGGG